MRKSARHDNGITIVEMIIVMAIVIIVIGMIVPTVVRQIDKSKKLVDVNTSEKMKDAIEMILVLNPDADSHYLHQHTKVIWHEKSLIKGDKYFYQSLIEAMGKVPVSKYDDDLYWVVSYGDELDYIFLVEDPSDKEGYMLYPEYTDYYKETEKQKIPTY